MNMGTNYYLRTRICESCGRHDNLHIGKSSMGWIFAFRGHDNPLIKSAKDWKREMEKGKIFDEYGEELEDAKFWNLIRVKKEKGTNFDYANDYPKDSWHDEEGNSFSGNEFS